MSEMIDFYINKLYNKIIPVDEWIRACNDFFGGHSIVYV